MSKNGTIEPQTATSELVSGILDALRRDEKTDTELLEILSTNIVKEAPSQSAVDDSSRAIEALATQRAEESADDLTDRD